MTDRNILTNDRVALDKDWRIFVEPYLEGFQLTISRGHYDEEVILSADEAKALRDWLCARYPVEPPAEPPAAYCSRCGIRLYVDPARHLCADQARAKHLNREAPHE